MLVVRAEFQARYGRVDELVVLWQEMKQMIPAHAGTRVMTDASAGFFRVVVEMDVANFEEWVRINAEEEAHPGFGSWFERMVTCTESGSREFFTLVE